MTRRLPIIILSLVISHLSFAGYVRAQEITSTNTTQTQINPQALGSDFEIFMKKLIPEQFQKIPDTLVDINRLHLPLEIGESIGNKANSAVKPQAVEGGKNQDIVANAAGQYTIASGVNTPSVVSNASTNIISDFFANLAEAIGNIFQRGEKGAQQYAGSVLPKDSVDQIFDKTATNMDRALPLVECGDLPADLCTKNKPNAL